MDEFDGIYKSFSERIKWCNEHLIKIEKSTLRNKERNNAIGIILGYKKNCHICCRAIQLIRKGKQTDDINSLVQKCNLLRFNKFQLMKEYVSTLQL